MLVQDIEDIDVTVVWWKWQEFCFLVLFIFLIVIFFSPRACSFYNSYRLGKTLGPHVFCSLVPVGSLERQTRALWRSVKPLRTERCSRTAGGLGAPQVTASCLPHTWARLSELSSQQVSTWLVKVFSLLECFLLCVSLRVFSTGTHIVL